MNQFPFQLEKYKTPASRYRCPACGQGRRLTRYVYTDTGEHLADHVGRCDRQDSCGYHYTPGQFFREHPERVRTHSGGEGFAAAEATGAGSFCGVGMGAVTAATEPQVSYIRQEEFHRSFMRFSENHFVQYLYSRYPREEVIRAITAYRIGTSRHWPGASVWWQCDAQQRYRTGKVMLYDAVTGRRVREPFSHVSWMHTVLGLEGFRLRQCLFGEHLLPYHEGPVAVTESEKTALIASILMPEMIWMATGGKELLSADKLLPLRGRRVLLYPDQGGYELWSRRAAEMRGVLRVDVCDLLERGGKGMDIADYLTG